MLKEMKTRNLRIYTEGRVFVGSIISSETDNALITTIYNRNVLKIVREDNITLHIKVSHITAIEILNDSCDQVGKT